LSRRVARYNGCCKTIAACETVIERNSTGFTVKCENDCPVVCSDGCCKTIAACETVIERNSTGFTVEYSTGQEFSHLTVKPVEFLSTTVSQTAIVLQQPSEHSTGQSFSRRVVRSNGCCKTIAACETVIESCFAGRNCLTTASEHPTGK
jgi:hypothetical protein